MIPIPADDTQLWLEVELYGGPRDGDTFGLVDDPADPPVHLEFSLPSPCVYQRTSTQRHGATVYSYSYSYTSSLGPVSD